MDFWISIFIIMFISAIIFTVIDYVTRPQRFSDAVRKIKTSGGKIRYMNERTGTISYVDKSGKYLSISVYRGYNSHAK